METNYIDKTLEFISSKCYQLDDHDFFNEVSKFLAHLFDVDYVIIDKCISDKKGFVQIESFFDKKENNFLKKREYNLKGSPCEIVIKNKECIYSKNTKNLFPNDTVLKELDIESYLGVSLLGKSSHSIGLIAILDTKPRLDFNNCLKALQIIALKVEKRLEQQLYNEKLEIKNNDLEFSKNRLDEAQYLANLGSFTLNVTDLTWESNAILDLIIGIDGNFKKDLINLLHIVHPQDRDRVQLDIKNIIYYQNGFYSKEYKIIRASDQKVRRINTFGKIIIDENGNSTKIVGTMQDVTESKEIQEELLKEKNKAVEIENFYKAIIENAGDALYLQDLEGNFIEVNNNSVIDSGYSKEELLTMKAEDLDVNFPTHEEQISIRNLLIESNTNILESVHRKKDGSLYPVEIKLSAIQTKGKHFILAIARNISERVKSESENKILSAAVQQSSNSVVITDIDGNIEYVNHKFTELTGYSESDLLGKNPRILNSGLQSDAFYINMWKTLSSGNSWQGKFQNKAKNGTLFWEHATISPVKNKAGKVINYLGVKENITDKKIAEEKLLIAYDLIKESEDFLKRILKTANEGFWIIDPYGNTVEVNDKLCKILGYAETDFIDKSVFNFVDEQNASILKNQIELRDEGESSSYEVELIKNNGKKVICLFNTSPIFDNANVRVGSFALVTDITKLKEATKKLKLKNKELNELSLELFDKNKLLADTITRYLNLFEQSPISILEEDYSDVFNLLHQKKKEVGDLETYLNNNSDFVKLCIEKIKINKINESTLTLFKVKDKKEFINHLRKTNNEKSFENLKNVFLMLASGEKSCKYEAEFTDIEENKINVLIKFVLINNNGKAISSVIDITNIKNTETALRISKDKAEESNRLKTEFLNNMSHEIRTPMNGILGFSELLANPNLSEIKRNYFINIIQNSGKQLLNVIDDILEISRLGTKQVKVIETKVCLNDLLLELFAIFNLKAKENGVPLYVKNELSDMESTIYTDSTKLQKILSNLIENALKFTNSGSISFGYHLVNNEHIIIYVKDTGIGIKEEKQHLIFERFSQEERDVSRNSSGLGLGLSIAKENTTLIGGEIWVESEKWKGSTFWVKIPYKPVIDINKLDNIMNKGVAVKNKYKIVVAEDEEVNYLFIEILLQDRIELNCDIYHAKNGKEAVEYCEKIEDIDFVLMDINMPIMDGYTATKKIKELRPNLPVIAQTAYSTPEDKQKALDAGCCDFISKPINKDLLKAIIDKFLVENLELKRN